MPPTKRLTNSSIKGLTKPGKEHDGIYVVVGHNGSKRFMLRVQWRGERIDFGLGPFTPQNGIAEARITANRLRNLMNEGIDPRRARRPPKVVPRLTPTFEEQSEMLIAALAPGWRGAKTEAGWRRNLLVHAKQLGAIKVDEVTTEDVLGVLKPFWSTKPETGGKLRERIERVLDSANAEGCMEPGWENPARWRGCLMYKLPKRPKLSRGHFLALPYTEAPEFVSRLRSQRSMGARALEFTILTAARETMTTGALWDEIQGDTWIIPASRMKNGSEFRIPLSNAALAVLEEPGLLGRSGYIFAGSRPGTAISNATMDAVIRRMKVQATVHGFRSTFRDWAGDCTHHTREVTEIALAHKFGGAVERSYRRMQAFEKRRALMQDWADYLTKSSSVCG